MVLRNHGNDTWYCMYEAYIKARDSTYEEEEKYYCMNRHMACGVFSFLKE